MKALLIALSMLTLAGCQEDTVAITDDTPEAKGITLTFSPNTTTLNLFTTFHNTYEGKGWDLQSWHYNTNALCQAGLAEILFWSHDDTTRTTEGKGNGRVVHITSDDNDYEGVASCGAITVNVRSNS